MIRNQNNKLLVDGEFSEENYLAESDVWQDVINSEKNDNLDKGLSELSARRKKVYKFISIRQKNEGYSLQVSPSCCKFGLTHNHKPANMSQNTEINFVG